LLKASQQRTVLILDLRQQIGYEGISQLAVGRGPLAVGTRKKKIFAFFLLSSSFFLLPSSFSMIPVISIIPVVQLASGDRLSLQVYQFQGAVPETKGYI
jgi:hypothetical protein